MSLPQVFSETAFATDPGASPTWVDTSSTLMEFSTQRGRQKELDVINAGTCTKKHNNSDRRYDPTNTAGIYYPNVLPMRRDRLRLVHNAVTYYLFTGYVERWPQEYGGPNTAFSTVTVADGFLPLSKADIGSDTAWPEELSGARIGRALDAAGWPAADRVIDTGYSLVADVTLALGSGVSGLQHCEQVADAELGVFFIDGQGRAVFHDRHHRRGSSYIASAGTFGDALSGFLPYTNLVPDYDVEKIWNDVRVTVGGGTAQQSQDSTSQTRYLKRSLARAPILGRDTEAADQAAYLLNLYKDPQLRFVQLTIKPGYNDALWVQALGREIGDHITVKRQPPGGGPQISQECFIESIQHHATPALAAWETTWLLSTPAYSTVDWWLLGDATYGVLSSTTKLLY